MDKDVVYKHINWLRDIQKQLPFNIVIKGSTALYVQQNYQEFSMI